MTPSYGLFMRTFRRGSAAVALLSVLLLLAVGTPARAAEPLRFSDAAGDQLDARGSMDVVSVSLEVKPMAPRNTMSLVTTIELAAPPESMMASYDLNATVPGCGYFSSNYRPGSIWAQQFGQVNQYFMECGSPEGTGTGTSTAVDARVVVEGNKVVIWAAVTAFPKEVLAAGELTDISASTQIADPLMGIMGNSLAVPTDEATTDKSWRFV